MALKSRPRDADLYAMPDIIPRTDGDFSTWAKNLLNLVNDHQFDWPVNGGFLIDANDAQETWAAAYAAAVAARAAAEAATKTKQQARADYEAALRPLVRQLQALPEVSDADRANLGITIRTKGPRSVPPPTSRPVAIVASGERLTHALRLVDEAGLTTGGSARGRTARPRGAARAEVFVALTPPGSPAPPPPRPVDSAPTVYRYVGSVSDGSTTLTFDAAKGGQQAHYLARWVNTAGEPGPWSETVSATVAA